MGDPSAWNSAGARNAPQDSMHDEHRDKNPSRASMEVVVRASQMAW